MMPFDILAAHGLRPGGGVGAFMNALKYCSRFSGFFLGVCPFFALPMRPLDTALLHAHAVGLVAPV